MKGQREGQAAMVKYQAMLKQGGRGESWLKCPVQPNPARPQIYQIYLPGTLKIGLVPEEFIITVRKVSTNNSDNWQQTQRPDEALA